MFKKELQTKGPLLNLDGIITVLAKIKADDHLAEGIQTMSVKDQMTQHDFVFGILVESRDRRLITDDQYQSLSSIYSGRNTDYFTSSYGELKEKIDTVAKELKLK